MGYGFVVPEVLHGLELGNLSSATCVFGVLLFRTSFFIWVFCQWFDVKLCVRLGFSTSPFTSREYRLSTSPSNSPPDFWSGVSGSTLLAECVIIIRACALVGNSHDIVYSLRRISGDTNQLVCISRDTTQKNVIIGRVDKNFGIVSYSFV